MFADNAVTAGMGLDVGSQQRNARLCGRLLLLFILALMLYPFLWAWTVMGTLWFSKAKSCLEEGQKWGFLIWLLFSYCGLLSIACFCIGKWLRRREAHIQNAQPGIPISEIEVFLDMFRVPDWALEAARQEQVMGQDTGYHPGPHLTPPQREAVEALIQDLSKFRLKVVPADCSECLICLEEFQMEDEVRGLPCAHNFHVACIDEWLRLNVKCPRCRSLVFPDLDLNAISNLPPESVHLSVVTTSHHARSQPSIQSQIRIPGLLCPIRSGNADPRVAASPLHVDLEDGHITESVVQTSTRLNSHC